SGVWPGPHGLSACPSQEFSDDRVRVRAWCEGGWTVMILTQAARRAAIRATNAVGSMLSRTGLPAAPFDEQQLLDAARRATHLDHFGEESFGEPLRMLLHGLETEAHLTPLGCLIARRDTVDLLANRLRLQEDRKRNPSIGEEP